MGRFRVIDVPEIAGLKLVVFDIISDARGWVQETSHEAEFAELGLPTRWAYDMHSCSVQNVVRGMHYHAGPTPPSKLVRCDRGEIEDVVLDLRAGSPTYGASARQLLFPGGPQILVPPGCAHGFRVCGIHPAVVHYKVTSPRNPAHEGAVRWDEDDLPTLTPVLSETDRLAPTLAEYMRAPVFTWGQITRSLA